MFGISGTLNFTAGVLVWPFVFIMTDVINEYFGVRGVRLISWIAVGLIAYAFLAAYAAISLAPATFWVDINKGMGVPDIQKAYAILFGQGLWTICGSIVAFLVGQLIDVVIFHRILRVTGERFVWLRATASTAVSQLLDSFIVLYIAFVIGPQHWSIPQFLAIGTVNYVYKMTAAIALIPLLYVARIGIRAYLGHGEARAAAATKRRATRLRFGAMARRVERIRREWSCPCGCGRPCASATVSLRGSRMFPQPNNMRAAPMPRMPPPPRFAALHHRRTAAR